MARLKKRNVALRVSRESAKETHINLNEKFLKLKKELGIEFTSSFYDFGLTTDELETVIPDAIREAYANAKKRGESYGYFRYGSNYTTYLDSTTVLTRVLEHRNIPDALVHSLTRLLTRNSWAENEANRVEPGLASFALLNEFLEQEEIQTVGEFYDEYWDTILPKAFKLKFNVYTHSAVLLTDIENAGLLVLRPSTKKSDQREIEKLTRDEVNFVLNNHSVAKSKRYRGYTNAQAPSALRNIILERNGKNEQGFSEQLVMNAIFSTYAKAISKIGLESNRDLPKIWDAFNDMFKENWLGSVTRDLTKTSPKTVHTLRVKPYLDFLDKHHERFSLAELHMASFLWMSPHLVSRTGEREDVIQLFEQIFEKYGEDEDHLVEIIQVLAQGALSYDNAMPTMTQWRNALKGEDFEAVISMEIFYEIVSGDTQGRTYSGKGLTLSRKAFESKM